VNIINLLIGNVFKAGVDDIYGPMSEFAEIPPPLFEQVDKPEGDDAEAIAEAREILSAKYMYFDDRPVSQNPSET
jgi:hypothetical protein